MEKSAGTTLTRLNEKFQSQRRFLAGQKDLAGQLLDDLIVNKKRLKITGNHCRVLTLTIPVKIAQREVLIVINCASKDIRKLAEKARELALELYEEDLKNMIGFDPKKPNSVLTFIVKFSDNRWHTNYRCLPVDQIEFQEAMEQFLDILEERAIGSTPLLSCMT